MFDAKKFVEETIEYLKANIDGNSIIAVSGGVDSTVAAKITHMAIGDRLYPIFIDTGLMRKNEANNVKNMFLSIGMNIIVHDASDDFLLHLKNVTDPEQKRKIIGERFIRNFENFA